MMTTGDIVLNYDDDTLFSDQEIKIVRPMEFVEDYYKIDRMSHSRMKFFRQSPRHYLYSLTHFEETPAMILGRAFHAIVLEEDRFEELFYTIDETKRPDWKHGMTSNENKDWKRTIEMKNVKRSFLSDKMLSTVQNMRDSLFRDPFAVELFQEIGWVERAMFWTDPVTGEQIKMKLDAGCDDFTLDLKSCMNAKPEIFQKHAFDMEYTGQGALYRNGRPHAKDEHGRSIKLKKGDFYFIAVEKEAPFGVSVNKCDQAFFRYGEDLYLNTLEDIAYWRQMGAPDVCYEWRKPLGYSTLSVPYWAKNRQ